MKSMISFFAYARSEVSGHSEVSGPSGVVGTHHILNQFYRYSKGGVKNSPKSENSQVKSSQVSGRSSTTDKSSVSFCTVNSMYISIWISIKQNESKTENSKLKLKKVS